VTSDYGLFNKNHSIHSPSILTILVVFITIPCIIIPLVEATVLTSLYESPETKLADILLILLILRM
jgi:hypothetical protein